jgi:type II secretory pathway pseudopilin PulG
VIAIIGLLSTIAIVSMNGSRDKARIASGQSFEQSVLQKLGDRLEGEWKFENLSGSATPDTSGNGRTGTVANGSLSLGFSGQAISFAGTGYVDIGTISVPTDVTVSAWIKPSVQCQNGFIVGKDPINTQWELFLNQSDCAIYWRGGTSGNQITCSAPSIGAWHHVLGTQYGMQAAIYVDGKQCATGTVNAIANGNGNIQIGAYAASGGAYNFNGLIDEVRIYSGSVLE